MGGQAGHGDELAMNLDQLSWSAVSWASQEDACACVV